ncbi:Loc1 protein [Starmerella bacillaris]|uniref:60S ribosomal subunit assembly/export protein LOC1 n=1 Tax=Starmerella bacillaris TaxID=1247836 RepID=A0AAV5RFN3_STABA|nr:Loc1 protein [Starmerella bacillaris]
MGKPRKSRVNKKSQSAPREVAPDVHKDKMASNMLNFSKPQYQGVSKNNKARDRAISKGKLSRKKKERVYTEKELGIPKLNTALDPVGVKVKGKKGKKFVNDTSMQIILAEVLQQSNEAHASKLERARQLEAIREAKRKEIDEKEQQDKQRIDDKKKELKNRKRKGKGKAESKAEPETAPKKGSKKRVSFAV